MKDCSVELCAACNTFLSLCDGLRIYMLHKLETVESRPSSRDQGSVASDDPFMRSLPAPSKLSLSDKDMDVSPTSGRNDPNSAWQERRANSLLSGQEPLQFTLGRSESPSLPNRSSEGLLARQLRGLSVEREHSAD